MTYGCVSVERAVPERERLILEHLPQVRLIARRIHERLPVSVSLDDLISAGVLGLISAVDNFDPAQNVKLKTYAEHKIRGAILDSLRGLDWAPRDCRKKAKRIEAAIASAEQRLGRTAADEEIAEELGLPIQEYYDWLAEVRGLALDSFDDPGSAEKRRNPLDALAGSSEDSPLKALEMAELERLVAGAVERMPAIERNVLSLYYQEELSLKEIAAIVNLHLSRVSQIKSQAILRLRAYVEKRWPLERGKRT